MTGWREFEILKLPILHWQFFDWKNPPHFFAFFKGKKNEA